MEWFIIVIVIILLIIAYSFSNAPKVDLAKLVEENNYEKYKSHSKDPKLSWIYARQLYNIRRKISNEDIKKIEEQLNRQ
jgi:hypothetical protein